MILRLSALSFRMLRYRVAAMIWMFMLLAAAFRGGLQGFDWGYVWATIALAAGYVAATTVNDIADKEIDLVNHPLDRGRPLVTGEASERDLAVLHVIATAVALFAGAAVGQVGLIIVILSLIIGELYSLPPVRLSHRTYLAPLILGVAYVLVPYALGLQMSDTALDAGDAVFASALFALFLSRITLKDFRDREGDARFGRPTLLLRFGKSFTCSASLVALVAGNALLLAAIAPPPIIALAVEVFVGSIVYMLSMLWRARSGRDEQVAIGIGARMGNGLLITVLGWLILSGAGAAARDGLALVGLLTALFAVTLWAALARPGEVVIGYKG